MTSNPNQSVPEDDELFDACPVSQAFEQIGSKWRLVVMHSIHKQGEQRFSELQETTSAESATLSRVLDELEELGFVNRRLEDRPIATYYSLTGKGKSLATVFDEIEAWADEWTTAESSVFESLS
jgi:DNA-binding HxlR family transcriptional regulator